MTKDEDKDKFKDKDKNKDRQGQRRRRRRTNIYTTKLLKYNCAMGSRKRKPHQKSKTQEYESPKNAKMLVKRKKYRGRTL